MRVRTSLALLACIVTTLITNEVEAGRFGFGRRNQNQAQRKDASKLHRPATNRPAGGTALSTNAAAARRPASVATNAAGVRVGRQAGGANSNSTATAVSRPGQTGTGAVAGRRASPVRTAARTQWVSPQPNEPVRVTGRVGQEVRVTFQGATAIVRVPPRGSIRITVAGGQAQKYVVDIRPGRPAADASGGGGGPASPRENLSRVDRNWQAKVGRDKAGKQTENVYDSVDATLDGGNSGSREYVGPSVKGGGGAQFNPLFDRQAAARARGTTNLDNVDMQLTLLRNRAGMPALRRSGASNSAEPVYDAPERGGGAPAAGAAKDAYQVTPALAARRIRLAQANKAKADDAVP